MAHDPKALLDRLLELGHQLPYDVTTRPMMGGFIAYADGRTFVSLSSGGFGVKLLPDDQDRLLQRPGSERLRHTPEMPPSKTYITLAEADLADDATAIEWLTVAARSAPAAKAKKRRHAG